jgi:DNA-binding CsgD family transcriptional regulator
MPLDPQNTAQIRDRELRVWDLLLKGIEGIDIARREGVHPSVISRIKTRVERRITAETDGKAASLKARQIGEIRRARREAWRAWEESCKPAAKTTRRSGGKGLGASGSGTVEQNEVKGQNGNPAFLDKVYDGIRLEARLTGTEAPHQQQIAGRLTLEDLIVGATRADDPKPSDPRDD